MLGSKPIKEVPTVVEQVEEKKVETTKNNVEVEGIENSLKLINDTLKELASKNNDSNINGVLLYLKETLSNLQNVQNNLIKALSDTEKQNKLLLEEVVKLAKIKQIEPTIPKELYKAIDNNTKAIEKVGKKYSKWEFTFERDNYGISGATANAVE